MEELLNEVIKYYQELQSDNPDNLALPNFHKAMENLIVYNESNRLEKLVSQAASQAMPSETIPCEQKCDVCNGWKKINDIYGECNTLRTSPYDYVIGEYEVENSEYETNQILTHKDFCCRLFANKR